ncbi:Glioma tumor suppressor-like protein [Rhynchospora pubera]|uniref:Ribosome biogenesis protein NOP53 n=1 Tax=Rhynchospora pubera TaxID=906938 RepID=A0AAV8I014_9POAL|nr:Glioma tumor suppressor-like protein [Rhynchospora pubera]
MGKAAKGSRKGKKAWRSNISTADIEDYLQEATRQRHSLGALPDDSLFFLSSSSSSAASTTTKRKTELHRAKPLRHEAPLRKNPAVVPLPPSTTSKQPPQKRKRQPHSHSKQPEEDNHDLPIWNDDGNPNPNPKKHHHPSTPSPIPPVEVDPLGCSFNPPFQAHQDALAKAVADEMQKLYKVELAPQPVPLTVPGQLIPEEEKFFLDADHGHESNNEDDDDDGDANQGEHFSAPSKSKTKKVTRVELNRRARRKELLRAQADAKKIHNLSKQIDSLPDILKEIEKEDEEKDKRHTRRVVAKQERLKTAPPRLGKPKFVPPPVQVLLTEEITGSLRKLKGCCTLARDRFKSLEKRALIVPRSNKRSRN